MREPSQETTMRWGLRRFMWWVHYFSQTGIMMPLIVLPVHFVDP